MMLRSHIVLAFAVLLLNSLPVSAADASTHFLQTHYYLLSLGRTTADVDTIRHTIQSSSFSLIAYAADSVQVFRGTEPVETPATAVLADEHLLVVDDGRFFLRDAGEGYAYSVRPAENGYELVIDPWQDLPIQDVLGAVLVSLQSLGILGNQADLDVQSYAKNALKGPPPPAGIAIESTLYGLLVARDWFDYSATKGLALVGLRVDVVAELLPGAPLAEPFVSYVVGAAEGLVKLSLPIDQLLALARSTAVGYVRAPYRPSIP